MPPAPKKKWGQNFLRNPGAVKRIVEALAPLPDDVVLEIGPGEGVLTRELAGLPNEITVMEIDPDLVARLHEQFGDRLQIVHGDATELPLPARQFSVVGNLPYNVATPIIRRVLTAAQWRRAVFMVQKEVADRFTARIGDEAYGYLTLLTQLYARATRLLTLEPGSFFPPPRVRSAVVVFEPIAQPTRADRAEIAEIVSAAFRMRRKKLLNNLDGFRGMTRPVVQGLIENAGLAAGVRAEEMSISDFDAVALSLEQSAGDLVARSAPRR